MRLSTKLEDQEQEQCDDVLFPISPPATSNVEPKPTSRARF